MNRPNIYIGADHRGFEKKQMLKAHLETQGYRVFDRGAFDYDPDDDYPDFAFAVAEEVAQRENSKGILICGSSIGVTVAANKVNGIFCSSPRTVDEACEDIEHHNSNILALSADNTDIQSMKEIAEAWLQAEFQAGRHQRRLDKIWEYEKKRK